MGHILRGKALVFYDEKSIISTCSEQVGAGKNTKGAMLRGFLYRFLTYTTLLGSLLLLMFLTVRISSVTMISENHYYLGDAEYRAGHYSTALDHFRQALQKQPALLHRDPLLKFKLGVALLKTEHLDSAIATLRQAERALPVMGDYAAYFRALACWQKGDTSAAMDLTEHIREKYPNSPLLPQLDSLYARIFLARQNPDSARKYLLRMAKQRRFDRSLIYLHLMQIARLPDDSSFFRKYAYLFLKRYPLHHDADAVYRKLRKTYSGKIPFQEFKTLVRYLFTSKQFLTARKLIREQQTFARTKEEKDYLTWLPIEAAYRQGEYRRVLKWCQKNRTQYPGGRIRRNIELHIARCYSRLGRTRSAITKYLEFRKQYPGDPLADEILWKVAWLYEGLGKLDKAIEMYRLLISLYPRSEFRREADFRIGLDYYRQGAFKQALSAWEEARKRSTSPAARARLNFWIGKCYAQQGDSARQWKIYLQLAQRPVDSYYNLKAFFLTSREEDLHREIRKIFWELHHQAYSYLPVYLNYFNRPMLVKELLGNRWGSLELQSISDAPSEWKFTYAVGELHERWRNYGEAYRKFRAVYNSYFAGSQLPDMLPVFKRLYPFYYQEWVEKYADSLNVPTMLIYAVLKKESNFDPRALSYANAYGLMQLIPGTASQVAAQLKIRFSDPAQLFQPALNIRMGVTYLSHLLKQFQQNPYLALAAYNAGPHRVERWQKKYGSSDDDFFLENIEFEQTRHYVRECMRYYWLYQLIVKPDAIPAEVIPFSPEFTQELAEPEKEQLN